MPLVPLNIPPGFVRNGTDMDSSGRWRDGNLVRWVEGSLRPVGGWRTRKSSAASDAIRGMHVWRDNAGDRNIGFGTYNKLYYMSSGSVVSDITPVGLTAGRVDATENLGYGGSTYGTAFYGVERPDATANLPATTWQLDNWGEYLVAFSDADGKLYEWQLNTATPAAAITNAPTGNTGMVVTEERFIFALGAGNNPRKVEWCDQEDNTTWTPASTNQAGGKTLQTSGKIVAGVRTRGQVLIVTDNDAHRAIYTGPPFIYNFERVGSACGLVAPKAIVDVDAGAFWMGRSGFHHFDGNSVQDLPCPVHDYIFNDLNKAQISKCWAVRNGQNDEVWFFFPSATATEIDKYVAYNYQDGTWLIGELSRTSGVERGTFNNPIYADASGNIYDHETGYNYGGADVYAETGPLMMGNGDNIMNVLKMYPDELNQGDVTATFKTRLYPNDTERSYGPYSMAAPTSVRFSGRQARMRVTGNTLGGWRVGTMRLETRAAGRR